MRRLRLLVLVLLLVAVAAGCRLDVALDVAMQPDGSGTVTLTATADAELVAKAPSAFADLRLDDIRRAGWTVTGPTRAADGAMAMTLAKPFGSPAEANAILAELNGPNGPLHGLTVAIDRSFAVVRSSFTGSAQLTGGLAAFSDDALVRALGGAIPLANVVTQPLDQVMGLTVTARLPGRVTSANGTVAADQTSVTWRPSLAEGAATSFEAHFEQTDQGAKDARQRSHLAWGALVVYLGALLLLTALGALWLRHRRGRRSRGATPGAT
jgi:hypothetical protein